MFYTGVGSRKTPLHILQIMTEIANKMAKFGYTLRSGGAQGADSAFESGAGSLKQIYYAKDANAEAMAIAQRFHPAWDRLSTFAKKLHGRNAFQVLGMNLSIPSDGLLCWTPDQCSSHSHRSIRTGGTGTAISIAEAYGVPISNLSVPSELFKWRAWANDRQPNRSC